MAILDQRDKVLKNKVMSLVRQLGILIPRDSIWELEGEIQGKYPYLFPDTQVPPYKVSISISMLHSNFYLNFEDEIFVVR